MSLSKYAQKTLQQNYLENCHQIYRDVGEQYEVTSRNHRICINLGDIFTQGRYLGKMSIVSTYGMRGSAYPRGSTYYFRIKKQRIKHNVTNPRFIHPNVYFEGSVCYGNIAESIHRLCINKELLEIVHLTKAFLYESFENGYVRYERFKCMKCNLLWHDCLCVKKVRK